MENRSLIINVNSIWLLLILSLDESRRMLATWQKLVMFSYEIITKSIHWLPKVIDFYDYTFMICMQSEMVWMTRKFHAVSLDALNQLMVNSGVEVFFAASNDRIYFQSCWHRKMNLSTVLGTFEEWEDEEGGSFGNGTVA